MTVFVAGGSGTIGLPLVRALAASGHQVFASTRSPEKTDVIRRLGATPVVVDALDGPALERAVRDAAPTHVIHQLTALPKHGPRTAADLEATNRLRREGTRNLLQASLGAGVRRLIGGSFALMGAGPAGGESDPMVGSAIGAVRSMESQILDAARGGAIEGIILRYGLFYGPDTPPTLDMLARVRRRRVPVVRGDHGHLPCIHLDDAVSATVAALTRGESGGAYDIVDDQAVSFSELVTEMARIAGAPRPWRVPAWLPRLVAPYMARVLMVDLPLSNAPARQALGWMPMYPTVREGMRQTVARAA